MDVSETVLTSVVDPDPGSSAFFTGIQIQDKFFQDRGSGLGINYIFDY
jgi:hypothetical protein